MGGTSPDSCGDGIVDDGEQCDDGGTEAGDGCDDGCMVECDTILRPVTLHCYVLEDMPLDWFSARTACENLGPGWSLAGLVDLPELIWISAEPSVLAELVASRFIWIGGEDQQTEGQYQYINGEPFPTDLWHLMQPDDYLMSEDCIDLWRQTDGTLGINDDDCVETKPSLCERAPAGSGT